jgi:hypothetical protein
MDGENEPREPRKTIAPDEWKKFLQEFSSRNRDRRARFDVFRHRGAVEEEMIEAHLEEAKLISESDAKNVEITRIDRRNETDEKITDTITNVRAVIVQYDPDGSENSLEFIDDMDALVSLRFESKIDGKS